MIPSSKPEGRTLAEFKPLKPAELDLLQNSRLGTVTVISNTCPNTENVNNIVRGSFLRFLALGGDEFAPIHEHGVQLSGAWILDELEMVAARIPSNLKIHNCHFDSVLFFIDTRVSGTLDLSGCQVPGFFGSRLVCDGSLLLRQFTSTLGVVLQRATIGGDLDCAGAILEAQNGVALLADMSVTRGSVFLNRNFITKGEVHLLGVQIDGALVCSDATIVSTQGVAMIFDGAAVKGGVFLSPGFTAKGEVRLLGAHIGGSFNCQGAILDILNSEGNHVHSADGWVISALSTDGAVINGSVFLSQNFTANGLVRLVGTHIGGNLECNGANFNSRLGEDALWANGSRVEKNFSLRNLAHPTSGIKLSPCHVGQLIDHKESWGERLVLDGFTYDSIVDDAPTDADTRLAWLDKQLQPHAGLNSSGADFKPQPWKQLSKVLQEMGHTEDARKVSIAFENRLRDANLIGNTHSSINRRFYRIGHWLLWALTGYGYRPLRLLVWMFCMWLLCAMFYWYAALVGVFAPSNPLIFQNPEYAVCKPDYVVPQLQDKSTIAVKLNVFGAGNWYLCDKMPAEYSGLNPLAYSLDVILPLVDLQQETSWSPLIPTPKDIWYLELIAIFDLKHFTRLVLWTEILFGWVFSLLLVAVISGLTKRRNE